MDALKAEKATLSSLLTESTSTVTPTTTDTRGVYQKMEEYDRRRQEVRGFGDLIARYRRPRSRRTHTNALLLIVAVCGQAQAKCAHVKDRFINACVALEETRLCTEKLLALVDPDSCSSPTVLQSAFLVDGVCVLCVIVCVCVCVCVCVLSELFS